MEKIIKIQQKENLNEVFAIDEKGNGGAHHKYMICSEGIPKEGDIVMVEEIHFQNGPRKEKDSLHGVLDSDLLEIVKHRLECFQAGPYSSEYNEKALHHVTEALKWLNERVEDRIKRNTLGKNLK